ncbi:MAG: GspE/PulE family protein [Rhizobiaceae bacterium]
MAVPQQARDFIRSLVDSAVLQEGAASRLAAALEATGHPLDAVVTELGLMREEVFAKAAAAFVQCRFVEQPGGIADAGRAEALGIGFLTANALLPVAMPDGSCHIAAANPFDSSGLNMVEYEQGAPASLVVATRNSILAALVALAAGAREGAETGGSPARETNEDDLDRLRDFARQEPVVRFVSRIVQAASDAHATDIHIEPFEHELRVRFRVDGALETIETAPASLLPGIVTRIKILSGLDISERRLPQDGRMRLTVRGQEMDLRVSISPVIHGETIVLRVLDRAKVALDLTTLGFDARARRSLEALARLPNGIVLITGPTGSGKTTTLYALMSLINDPAAKIFTAEDPVEYRLDGITQLQTNVAAGLTFSRALRSILRQDPDIILIGEIRDKETAEIAMQAALTGHLVLSTLHTNSAAGAITRLRDMGIDDYLIGATLKGVAAQRLLRKTCGCPDNESRAACAKCGGTGMQGRTATYEIASIGNAVSRLISGGSNEETVLRQLEREGFVTLDAHAAALARAGLTSAAEAARVAIAEAGAPR